MIVYRLASGRFPANDGAGASLYGGRWNHKGTPVIYTAATRALCALEILANTDEMATHYIVIPIEITDDLHVITIPVESLPKGWDEEAPTTITRDMGTRWAQDLTSAVLAVPSAVVPREYH